MRAILLILLGIILVHVVDSQGENSIFEQMSALKALYDSTKGLTWDWTSLQAASIGGKEKWNFTVNAKSSMFTKNYCNFIGVVCAPQTETVMELQLIQGKLRGSIPNDLGYLTDLQKLVLVGNPGLSGKLPTAISSFTALRQLKINNNSLGGPIPFEIDEVKALRAIWLNDNVFTGVIPGTLLSAYGAQLQTLEYSGNSGTSCGRGYGGNAPNGTCVACLAGSFKTTADNGVCTKCPANTAGPTYPAAETEECTPCPSGSNVPPGSCSCRAFQPTSVQQIAALESFYDATSGIMWDYESLRGKPGALPVWASTGNPWTFGKSASGMYVHDPCEGDERFIGLNCTCTISGAFKYISDDCTVNAISLTSGNLVGSIPDAIADLTGLRILELRQNPKLSGKLLPEQVSTKLTRLEVINLQNNGLTGSVPSTLGSLLSKLTTLKLDFNALDGVLPSSLRQLQNLQVLDISHNRMKGPLLDGRSRLVNGTYVPVWENMKSLVLSNNLFSGTLGDRTFPRALTTVDISDNKLVGSIPVDAFSSLKQLEILNLSGNSFTGVVPAALLNSPTIIFTYASHGELLCPSGYAGQGSIGKCSECPLHTYKDEVGDSKCITCPDGKNSTAGSSSCEDVATSKNTKSNPESNTIMVITFATFSAVAIIYFVYLHLKAKNSPTPKSTTSTTELERQLGLERGGLGPVRTPAPSTVMQTPVGSTQTPLKLSLTSTFATPTMSTPTTNPLRQAQSDIHQL